MGSFISFIQSLAGRLLRIVVGIALIALGFLVIHNVWGIVVAVIGLVPLIAGLAGICLFAPLFGYTLTGQRKASPIG
jgi:Protein of unknown function (DUF2892)